MWSGRNTFGNSTTLGSGKMGIAAGSMAGVPRSMDGARLLVHVVHQHVLPERPRRGEVGLAVADLRDPADEADQIGVPGEHERVDQDAGLAAGSDLGERLRDDERV